MYTLNDIQLSEKNKHLSLITSESVGIGHPDKICDQIADHVLTQCLKHDKNSRVACEVFASNHLIVIGGEITTKAYVDVIKLAWEVLLPLGYNENDFTILSNINKQSPEISQHVNKRRSFGAGDIGVVYGYATNETAEYLPLTYVLASRFLFKINELTKQKKLPGANFDTKCQVTCFYDENNKPVGIDTVIISLQHKKDANLPKLFDEVKKLAIYPIVDEYKLNKDFKVIFNNGGSFIVGGPFGDTGLTGRKLMVDTYGTIGRHGGGAFSGKDYTKVDRTGAYIARYIAKNIVAAKLADRCEVQMCYNIGAELPESINIDCFNTNKVSIEKIYQIVGKVFDLNLSYNIKNFDMPNLPYDKYSLYGHFNQITGPKPWEKTNKVAEIKKLI